MKAFTRCCTSEDVEPEVLSRTDRNSFLVS